LTNGELIVKGNNNILIILDENKNPKINLRKEILLLKRIEKDLINGIFRIWINEECLVRGISKSKYYGWYREDIARKLKIPVYKRITGGGVVYHDLGNLNWSFFVKANLQYTDCKMIFEKFGNLIAEALNAIGIEAYFSQPNRIEIDGYKISGMAAKVTNKAMLVHGTLLVRSNLDKLNMLCIPPPNSPPVQNICYWKNVSIEYISNFLLKYVKEKNFVKLLNK